MRDEQIMEKVRASVNQCTKALDASPSLRSRILEQAKGAPPVKKKFSAALALALALMLLSTSALAAAIFRPDILSWLFPGREAPEETVKLVQHNEDTQKSENAALTLNQTLFDGKELSVSFTLQNPTGQPLVYTVHHAKLNGMPLLAGTAQLPYGNYTGQALGGQVNGTALQTEDTFFVSFIGTSDTMEESENNASEKSMLSSVVQSPLQPSDEAILTVRVDVFEPLAEYTPVSQTEYDTGEYDIVTDKLPVLADKGLMNMASLPQPSRLKKIESLEFSFPIEMKETKVTTVSAAPGEYHNSLYTLRLDHFTLTHTGGKIEGSLPNPAPAFLTEQSFLSVFPEDVFEQALASNDHTLALRMASFSSGMSTTPDLVPADFHFDADFRSHAGTLPKGVYLVWLDDEQTYWDTALYVPLHQGSAPSPADAVD
ncbi:MAG: hypothetical protein IJB69_04205 [Clostridia bacterium]|nr:hypothetical protein [Clostridia bacterium]